MEIVDSQIHEPRVPQHPPADPDSELLLDVELAREAMDSVGVDAALANARTAFCQAAAERYPGRFGGCPFAGRAAAAQPEPLVEVDHPDIDGAIRAFRDQPAMLALRVVIRRFADGSLTDDHVQGRNEPIFAAAEKHGVPIFLQATGHMSAAAEIAKTHPDLILIIDHLGLNQPPAALDDEPWEAVGEVAGLAQYPNTALKLCGGSTMTSSSYPHSDIWPHYSRMIKAFTPDRVMWASDFSRLRNYGRDYADELHLIRDTNELSNSDKEKILGKTVRHLLRWPAPAGAAG